MMRRLARRVRGLMPAPIRTDGNVILDKIRA